MGNWSVPFVVAHGFADADPLPVPLPLLLFISGAILAAATRIPARVGDPLPPFVEGAGATARTVLRVMVVVLLIAIVLPATFGRSDMAANPAPLLLFTVGWAGLLLASMLVGPVWSQANPLLGLASEPTADDPLARLGVWPAVAALIAFTFAEQVLEVTPLVVLIVVGVYVLAAGGGALSYGRSWYRTADPVEVASRLLGRMAPVGRNDARVARRSVRDGVAATTVVAGVPAFLGVLVGASIFDAVDAGAALGSRALLFTIIIALCAGAATAAARPLFLASALIPVAAAHVAAHYLVPLLVDTQLAAIQASDPFGLGWNLLGQTGTDINAEPIPILAAQVIQLVLLVGGHALAMVVANDVAARRVRSRAVAATLFPMRGVILASLAAGVYVRLAS